MKRTIFIWDIHGCFDEFIALLEKIKYNVETDQLYLTGDLINKWPKAFELIDFLLKNPQIKSVIGNNEVNFIRYIGDLEIKGDFVDNGNYGFLIEKGLYDKKYEKKNSLFDKYLKQFSKEHIEYLLNLPLWIEDENWILLHWGLVPWKKLEEHHIDEITRIREYVWYQDDKYRNIEIKRPWYEYYDWEKTIIYWHWAADWLRIRKNTIWLDSGCVYWKHLTAYIRYDNKWLENDFKWWFEIVQVSVNKGYCPIFSF